MVEFDPEDLAGFDGKDGKPVYIVHEGRVFDVSKSKLWKGGMHMRRHHAGMDLTTDIQSAPHGLDVLERYPQVGVIKKKAVVAEAVPGTLDQLLVQFPMLRRHPHPSTVHFPIVFMLSTTVFNVIYLITGIPSFETTALHCLGAGVLFLPIVILTGLFSWWLNYMAKPMRAISIKIAASILLFVLALTAFTWRINTPGIAAESSLESFVYYLLIFSLTPLVVIIGWFGASLTFPIERDRN